MTKHIITVQPRTLVGRKVKKLRQQGLVPGNVFGKKVASKNIQIKTKEFTKLRQEVGESTLVYLHVEGEKEERPALIRDTVVHPVTGSLLHVSFHQVDLKEKVTAPVAIVLVGEAPAEKNKLGILVSHLNEIEVEALPTDMPENIKVDVSGLINVNQAIKVSDLHSKSNLTVLSDPEAIIVKIEPLAAEEKEAPASVEELQQEIVESKPVDSEAPPAEDKT